jgi:actin-related protein 3
VFPTAIATRQSPGGTSNRPAPPSKPSFLASGGGSSGAHLASKRGTEDLDFFIGDEAIQANAGAGYGIDYPIKHGIISDWSLMERYCNTVTILTYRYWEASIFKYLRCEPEDTYFLLVSLSYISLADERLNPRSIRQKIERIRLKSCSNHSTVKDYILQSKQF